ncbi:Linear gramicidin synthase subunit B [Micromonospora noduli]|uniref:Linear gramicidin synthase subunit B n=1 Tax=Micromonospora noduli TaxID=709876 RepID=A0A328N6R5_9ACTN|nr:condensation domain-containing protein [Micromonospora noduli]KAB1928222.1 hypothetical protein F8280_04055 [Micromonospora noduli]RAO04216.1 Linear gramicidin synthase subunit B [Micromonospora noduli]RAO07938.1 Linear gramicidin synthase subunit B [Micromonospora noduli]RAO25326.1 Linear gramicidin synthase subunit B [Micromonospora noduli]RAO32698.1 Linear gramicidin synthase subunit B [Micromonospora noduli]
MGTSHYPLMPQQRAVWHLTQRHPDRPVGNKCWISRYGTALEADIFHAAVDGVVQRHEALRTRFMVVDGTPTQVVEDGAAAAWSFTDLGGYDAAHRDRLVADLGRRAARLPFDLAAGPLLRVHLVRLASDDHVAIFTSHRMVCDAWSRALLEAELDVLYGALRSSRPSPLPFVAEQYGTLALKEQRRLQQGDLERHIDFWVRYLGGGRGTVELPIAQSRPDDAGGHGATLCVRVDPAVMSQVRDLSRSTGCTTFLTLFAGFVTLLHLLSGQDDINVGVPMMGRTRPAAANVVGLFQTTAVMRTRFLPGDSFAAVLHRARADQLAGFTAQDAPTDLVIDRLGGYGEGVLLHRHQFSTEESSPATEDRSHLGAQPFDEPESGFVEHDTNWNVWVDDDESMVRVDYASELFAREAVRCLVVGYVRLLKQVTATPSEPIRLLRPSIAEALNRDLVRAGGM